MRIAFAVTLMAAACTDAGCGGAAAPAATGFACKPGNAPFGGEYCTRGGEVESAVCFDDAGDEMCFTDARDCEAVRSAMRDEMREAVTPCEVRR